MRADRLRKCHSTSLPQRGGALLAELIPGRFHRAFDRRVGEPAAGRAGLALLVSSWAFWESSLGTLTDRGWARPA